MADILLIMVDMVVMVRQSEEIISWNGEQC